MIEGLSKVENDIRATKNYDRAKKAIDRGRPKKAARLLGRLSLKYPENPKVLGNLGIALSDSGKLEEAEAIFESLIEKDSHSWRSFANLGTVQGRMGKFAASFESYGIADEIGQQSLGDAYYWLGLECIESGEFAIAAKSFRHVVKCEPEYARAWCNLSFALLEINNFDDALEAAEKSSTLDPSDDLSWCNLGQSLEGLGRLEEALIAYDKSVEVNPEHDEDCWRGQELRERLSQDH